MTLDLQRALIELGSHNLAPLVGTERVEAILEVLQRGVNERELVRMLRNRYGTQLLANRELRTALLTRLPAATQGWLLDGQLYDTRTLTKTERQSLTSFRWIRESPIVARVLELYDLDGRYLPPRNERPPSQQTLEPPVQLFEHQVRVKDRLVASLLSEDRRVLVHMPTGAGKTRTTAEATCDFIRTRGRNAYCVWLAHSEELCEQAVSTLSMIWQQRGDAPLEINRLWGSHASPTLSPRGGWIVASLQRIHAMRLSKRDEEFATLAELRRRCKLLVMDEAHKSLAPTYADAIEFIADPQTCKIIGLTATPGRGRDPGENRRLATFYANNKISLTDEHGVELLDPIGYLQAHHYLARIERRVVRTNTSVELSPTELQHLQRFLDVPPAVLRRLAADAKRNAILLTHLCDLADDDKSIIVFACSVEHGHLLTEMLLIRGVEARCIDGTTSNFDRRTTIERYKEREVQVLVNYGVLTTGFDAPTTNAIVIARPTGSLVLYSQMLGRGIRGPKVGGNKRCLVLDVQDNIEGFPNERQAFTHFNDHWTTHDEPPTDHPSLYGD